MSIWILALGLCAVFAAIGFFSGAIRTSMMLLGVMLASFLTGPLAPKLTGLMPKIGIKHPLWIQVSPYLIVFALIALVVYGIGFAIHFKVSMIYKYQRDDYSRLKWERMNKHVGISVGLVIAIIVLFAVGRVTYAGGYLTAQLSDEGSAANNPNWVKALTAIRSDMQSTGLDKSVAALDNTPPYFYDAADTIGLIYHNPDLQPRLANYPPFLSLGQRPEFQEVSTDKEYNELIFGKAPFGSIINHPNTQRFLANEEVMNEFRKVDLPDLLNYLKTGKSKFDDEKILGRWILDKPSILTSVRKAQPDLKGNDLVALRKGLDLLPEITLINTPDNKSLVKAEGGAKPAEGATPGAPAPPPPPPSRYAPLQRPGGRGGPGQGRPAPRLTPAQAQAAGVVAKPPPVLQIAGEGEWKAGGMDQYQLTINDAAGKVQTLSATILDDELTLSKDGKSLVFVRAE